MRVRLRGTRGSMARPGAETVRYGGNTSCVEVRGARGGLLVLDAGTGIQGLQGGAPGARVDVLLTHLHMDHIQGLGFFDALHEPGREVHIWGPASTTLDLRERLLRYLSPPLFPVRLRDLACDLTLHDVPFGRFQAGEFDVAADLVLHPGPTVGYRIAQDGGVLAYLPDHEPALACSRFPLSPEWTSGFDLAEGAGVLIHDAQYTAEEYDARPGWGHSSIPDAVAFARAAGARRLVLFHHDPAHDDGMLDRLAAEARDRSDGALDVVAGAEGMELDPAA